MNFVEYQSRAYSTAIYPKEYKVIYPALKLNGEAGEVAELIGKMLRDDNGILSNERKARISKEVGDVLWYVAAVATDCGLDLNEIAEENIAKLASRKERGVLKGDGSDR